MKILWNNKSAIIAVILSAVCFAFYAYYSYATEKISEYFTKTVELTKIIAEKNLLIDSLKKDYQQIFSAKEELADLVNSGNKELEALKKKLFRENRNKKTLGELAKKRTSLIEVKVNKATQEVIRCFETISNNGDC